MIKDLDALYDKIDNIEMDIDFPTMKDLKEIDLEDEKKYKKYESFLYFLEAKMSEKSNILTEDEKEAMAYIRNLLYQHSN